MSADADRADALQDRVRDALERQHGLRICGSGSKDFLLPEVAARDPAGDISRLSLREHCGILDYRPEELVITARAGTPLDVIEETLARHRQRLPFEPPRFHGGGTLGGAVACGFSGPGRPWSGSTRDAVLGVEMLNGLGERLSFGGQVMKNVAGYDVSRLQTGAFGTLGVLLSISLRVAPIPAAERTLTLRLGAESALQHCREWARRAYPITATAWLDGWLRVRLAGAVPAVESATRDLVGNLAGDPDRNPEPEAADGDDFWRQLRDHELPFFAAAGGAAAGKNAPQLWRCVLPPAVPTPMDGCLVLWGGGLRWWRNELEPKAVRSAVETWGGSAQPFHRGFAAARLGGVAPAQADYQQRIRRAFDPQGLFNPELGLNHAD